MLARIDLRGSALPAARELAGLLPRAATDIDSVHGHRPPAVRGRPDPRRPGGPRDHRPARRRGRRGLRRPAGGARPGARRVRPGPAGRARGGRSRRVRHGARRPAPHRRHHPGRARRHGDRALGAGAPGRAVRARRPGAAAVQRRDERRARRRSPASSRSPWPPRRSATTAACPTRASSPRARCSASTEVYAVGGAQAIAMFGVRRRLLRAGRHGHRAGQRLRDRGQAAAARADRHRLRGRPDRDRDPRRRHRRPRARRGRPDQPGRARPAGRRGAGHRRARSSPTPSWSSCPGRWPPPSTPTGSPTALDGTQSGDRPGRRPRRRAAGRRRLRRRAPGDPDRATPREVAARVRNAGAIFVGAWSPVSLGDYCAGSNHVLPTGGCARHSSGLSCSRSCAASTSSSTTSRRSPRSPGTSTRSPAPRTCPRTRPPSASGSADGRDRLDELPLRPELRGRTPYGAPQLAVPRYRLNTNENPYPLPAELLADLGTALGHAARRAQPLPRPGRRRAARRPGRATSPAAAARRSRRRRCGRPTAPTRCCSRSCRRSAGAGRTALGFTPSYSMHPIISARHRHRRGSTGTAAPDFTIDAGRRRRAGARAAPRRRLRDQPEQPDRHRRRAGDDRRALRRRPQGVLVVDEAYAEFARAGTPSALTLLPGPAAADRQPDDEQGVRHGRAAAGLPGRRPRRRRRAAAGAAAVPPELAHPGRRADRAGAHRRAAGHGRRGQGAARPDRRRAARRWG